MLHQGALLSSERIRVERRANGEASSVMTSARAGANWSVDGSVGEAVGRWSDWGGRGVDEQPSWSTLGCRGGMARLPRPLGRACRTASGRPSHRGRCNRRLLDVEPTAWLHPCHRCAEGSTCPTVTSPPRTTAQVKGGAEGRGEGAARGCVSRSLANLWHAGQGPCCHSEPGRHRESAVSRPGRRFTADSQVAPS
jgi:hypothetical protein